MKEIFFKSNIWIGMLALTVALPIFVVGSAWLVPGSDLWSHFAQTLLPELVFNPDFAYWSWYWGKRFRHCLGLPRCYGGFSRSNLA